ncbi:hypothetical protein [Flavobacterium sp.]|jgi:hypothetical protein|uniref:hypothetical protein n=1 Tax=Flavobacterium sp. TaxID=239 RepID=UPI0037BE97B2
MINSNLEFLGSVGVLFLVALFFIAIHKYFLSKFFNLPFGISISLLLVFITSLYACYFTQFKSILFPVLVGTGILLYRSRSSLEYKETTRKYYFFLGSIVLHGILLFVQLYFKFLNLDDKYLNLNADFYFYINKVLLIKDTGVETILDTGFQNYPSPYHYFDLWFLSLFNELPVHYFLVFFVIILPFLMSVFVMNIYETANQIKEIKINFKNFLIVNFAVYLVAFLFPLIQLFEPIRVMQTSIFAYPKLLFVGFLLSVLFYFYFKKAWNSFFIFALVASLGFLVILPSVALFSIGLFLFLLISKKIKIDKNLGILLLFVVSSVVYIYFLYGNYITYSKETSATSTAPEATNNFVYLFVLYLFYAAYYVPFILLPVVNDFKLKNLKEKFLLSNKFLISSLLFYVSSAIIILIFHGKSADSNQFYFVTIIPFFSIWISLYLLTTIEKFSKIGILYFGFLLLFAVWANSLLITSYGQSFKKDTELIQVFIKEKPYPNNLAFLVKSKWKEDAYFVNPEFFAPEELFFIDKKPIKTYWIGRYKNDLPKDRAFFDDAEKSLLSTEFQAFYNSRKDTSEVSSQAAFLNLKKIHYLVVEEGVAHKEIAKLFTDSLLLPQLHKKIYFRK